MLSVGSSGTPGPVVSSETPAANATSVAVSSPISVTFNEPVQSGTITFTLANSVGTNVAGEVAYNGTTNTATFTPSAALANGTTYTATLSGAKDAAGDLMSGPVSWSFTTATTVTTSPGNLTAEWQFNEGSGTTTADNTGDGNTGTLVGSVSWTTSGLIGPHASSFSSSNAGHVLVADSPSLEFSATQSYTLSAWVDVPTLPSTWTAVVEKSRDTR